MACQPKFLLKFQQVSGVIVVQIRQSFPYRIADIIVLTKLGVEIFKPHFVAAGRSILFGTLKKIHLSHLFKVVEGQTVSKTEVLPVAVTVATIHDPPQSSLTIHGTGSDRLGN